MEMDRVTAFSLCVKKVSAAEDRVARRHASPANRVRIRESHTLARELVDARRLDLRRPVATEVAIAEIVGDDEEDVRLRCSQ